MANEYVSAAELKAALSITDAFADADVARAVEAASRAVDGICDTQFFPGQTGEVRKYTAVSEEYVLIDDASTITAVSALGAAFTVDVDYYKQSSEPGFPTSVLRTLTGRMWPRNVVQGVSVTGTFGWAAAPADVKQATLILAARLLKRSREAAFGVIGFDLDSGAVRIPGRDADVYQLLRPYVRSGMIE